jgi:hypothetical protein
METPSRERISIDLQGLKAPLLARSQALSVSPSVLVRKALEHALETAVEPSQDATRRASPAYSGDRTRLYLRMGRDDAMAVLAAARRAEMSPGDYVAGLVAGVPVLLNGGSRSECIAALTASNFEMSGLSRNIHALTRLLTQANVEQARVYRDMLDTLNGDVRQHLVLCSHALVELHPQRSCAQRGG